MEVGRVFMSSHGAGGAGGGIQFRTTAEMMIRALDAKCEFSCCCSSEWETKGKGFHIVSDVYGDLSIEWLLQLISCSECATFVSIGTRLLMTDCVWVWWVTSSNGGTAGTIEYKRQSPEASVID